jgi:hypothetical protein
MDPLLRRFLSGVINFFVLLIPVRIQLILQVSLIYPKPKDIA